MDRYCFKNLKFKNWHNFCYAISMPNDAVRHKKLFSRFLKIGMIFAIPKTMPTKTHLGENFPLVKIPENSGAKIFYCRDIAWLSILDLSGVETSPVESPSVGLFG